MRKEVKIGALVLVVVAVMIWGFNFLKGEDLFARSLNLETNYSYVDQLSASSPVLINGVKVGNVTDVVLDNNNVQNVIVRFTIENVGHIPKSARAVLVSTGLMGGKAIAIEFDKPCSGEGNCLEDGDKLASESRGLMSSMLGDGVIDGAMENAQNKIQELIGGEEGASADFTVIMEDLKLSVANLSDITTKINRVLASSTYDVKNVSSNLSKLSNTLNDNNQRIESILMNVETVTNDLKNANVSGAVANANTTMNTATEAITDLKSTIAATNASMAKITEIVDKVERGEGTLGMLVNDEELYKEIENTSEEIGLLLQDLRLNPKRYVNVSVFGKKQTQYVLPENDPALKLKQD